MLLICGFEKSVYPSSEFHYTCICILVESKIYFSEPQSKVMSQSLNDNISNFIVFDHSIRN